MGLKRKTVKREILNPRDKEIPALVKKIKKGNANALGELIDITQKRLYYFCLGLTKSEEKAQELCQETYLKCFDEMKSLDRPEGVLSWLFTISKRRFIDLTRSAEYKIEAIAEYETEEKPGVLSSLPSSDQLDPLEQREIVQNALNGLPEEDRVVLLLVDQQGYTSDEAAQIMGITESAVRSRVFRARKAFSSLFMEQNEGKTRL